MVDVAGLCADAMEEHDDIRRILLGAPEGVWDQPTPAPGWTVRDQVSHLAFFDDATRLAVVQPDDFRAMREAAIADVDAFVARVLSYGRELPGGGLLDRWREERRAMVDGILAAPAGTRMPWFGPDMGLASAVTARIMETWAHGQDIVDALGAHRPPTRRLRHVCDLGVRTRANSYRARGRQMPETPVHVELTGPEGDTWTWGPAGAADRISGDAEQFCLVVTQRRHVDDTDLKIEGADARAWMEIAQAFAGPPGPGRQPAAPAEPKPARP